jgi:hypothetical protein
MSKQINNKPILNKRQVAKIKRYLQSKEWADSLNNIQKKWNELEAKEKKEAIEWWHKIKDEPYMLCK